MTQLEDDLRALFARLSAEAPDPRHARERARSGEMGEPASRGRARYVVPSLVAASVAALIGGTTLVGLGAETPSNPAKQPSSSPTHKVPHQTSPPPPHINHRAVDRYVRKIWHTYGYGVQPVAQDQRGRLLFAAPKGVLDEMRTLDGDYVGGLRVQVIVREITEPEFENFIHVVSDARFPNHGKIDSFGLSDRSDYVWIHVRGLSRLSARRRADLEHNIQRVTDLPFRFRPSGHFVPASDDAGIG